MRPRLMARAAATALLGILTGVGGLRAQEPGLAVQVLARGQTDYTEVIGGPTDVVTTVITLAPGSTTGWHTHAGFVWAIVTRGELSICDPDRGLLPYPNGAVRGELPGDVHEGRNAGAAPVELVATFLLPAGGDLSSPAAAPSPAAPCGQ